METSEVRQCEKLYEMIESSALIPFIERELEEGDKNKEMVFDIYFFWLQTHSWNLRVTTIVSCSSWTLSPQSPSTVSSLHFLSLFHDNARPLLNFSNDWRRALTNWSLNLVSFEFRLL